MSRTRKWPLPTHTPRRCLTSRPDQTKGWLRRPRRLEAATITSGSGRPQPESPRVDHGIGAEPIVRHPRRSQSRDLIDLYIIDMCEGGKPPRRESNSGACRLEARSGQGTDQATQSLKPLRLRQVARGSATVSLRRCSYRLLRTEKSRRRAFKIRATL